MEAVHKVKSLKHIKLAAAFVALNMVDAALTWTLAGKGGYELNPITRIVLVQQSALAYWGFKSGRVLILVAALLYLANIYPRQMGKVFIVLIIIALGVCVFNLLGLLSVV